MKRLALLGGVLSAILVLVPGCFGLRSVRGTGDLASQEREVGSFSAVDLAGVGTVVIDYGDREALRIEAEENLLPYLESKVEGDTLTLGWREGVNVVPTQGIFYYLTARSLDEVSVSGLGNIDVPRLEGSAVAVNIPGGGDINIEEVQAGQMDVSISGLGDLTLNSADVERGDLDISGGGDINLGDLQVGDLVVSISGLGDVNIDGGEAATSDIDISGGGNYNARDLAGEDVTVSISGLGSAAVWPRDQLNAEISGGGSVRYNGSPQQIDQDVSGLGRVEALEGE